MTLQQFYETDDFDFLDEVIGDDLVVEGVVYDAQHWQHDGEGGVMRRGEVIGEYRNSADCGDVDDELTDLLHLNPWDNTK